MKTIIKVLYTNWKGETRTREIIPTGSVRWDRTAFHLEPQWLLQAMDVEKGEMRDFALRDCNFVEDHFPLTEAQKRNYQNNTKAFRED